MSDHNRPASSEYFQGKLYQQMHDDLHLAGVAQRTVDGYLRSVRQLADDCQCSPDQVSEQQLRNWLLYLKNEKEFAYGSLRVAFSGIKFFFTRTCKRDWEAPSNLQRLRGKPDLNRDHPTRRPRDPRRSSGRSRARTTINRTESNNSMTKLSKMELQKRNWEAIRSRSALASLKTTRNRSGKGIEGKRRCKVATDLNK